MYRIGNCTQCDTQVMVRDTSGKWNSFKPNRRQAYLVFESPTTVKIVICADCLSNPDLQKIMDSLLAEGSQAFNKTQTDKIKALGNPVKLQN